MSKKNIHTYCLAAISTLLVMCLVPSVMAAPWPVQAFESKQSSEVLQRLQLPTPAPTSRLQIDAPDKAENGAVVQIGLQWTLAETPVSTLALLAEANPTPLIALFKLAPQVSPSVVTRIKLAQTGNVLALATLADGTTVQQQRPVVVLEDGCSNSEREEPFASSLKLRARQLPDGRVELKMIVLHPMRTGRSKNDDGRLMPAHFMQQLTVHKQSQPLIEVHTGTAIARNPYFTFYLKELQLGDVLQVQWQDNLGYHGEGQVTVDNK